MEVLFTASNIEVRYDASAAILYCEWIGIQSEAELREAGEKIYEVFKARAREGCHRILNDNRRVLGHWYHSVEWTATYWFPRMIEAGLTQFAWVCADDVFSQLSARRALAGHPVIKTFLEYDEALHWLSN